MDRIRLAAASRDGHLALWRVERQQALIERLPDTRAGRHVLASAFRRLSRFATFTASGAAQALGQ